MMVKLRKSDDGSFIVYLAKKATNLRVSYDQHVREWDLTDAEKGVFLFSCKSRGRLLGKLQVIADELSRG